MASLICESCNRFYFYTHRDPPAVSWLQCPVCKKVGPWRRAVWGEDYGFNDQGERINCTWSN